jgi:hypothetical protein
VDAAILCSSLHNKRSTIYGGIEIALLLRKGEMQQNEFGSGSHQGLFYHAWRTVFNKLSYLVS